MTKYLIIKNGNGWYYASKKFLGIFNIGMKGCVSWAGGRNPEECITNLKKTLRDREITVVREIAI